MTEKIGIVGLGYVGLPIALACARKFPGTVGFDINQSKIGELLSGVDKTGELSADVLKSAPLQYTSDPADLRECTFFIVAVPTPVDLNRRPDLTALAKASELVGKVMPKGAVVVYESTVYPGVTEEFCGPILAKVSGFHQGSGFKLGYSPERINPGDKEHTLERITKVVAGEDAETLTRVASVYGTVIDAGVFMATSIKVAEAAKVIENTQRDVNIALMNELALIFDRMNIRTNDVLAAANTKWNFLPFRPGLVGGHCIGVDPYYLTFKAEELGYLPQVILSGRRINDGMGTYIAQRLVKMLSNADCHIKGARVGILGLTFKENVSDLRNSRIPDIVRELEQFGIRPMVYDPMVDRAEAKHEYGFELCEWADMHGLDALILAVAHQSFVAMPKEKLLGTLRDGGVIIDVKAMLDHNKVPKTLQYWSL